MGKPSTEDQVAEIDEIRERLASTIDQLVDLASPKSILNRTLAKVKGRFVDEQGSPRMETILPVAGGIVGTVGVIVVVRRIVNR